MNISCHLPSSPPSLASHLVSDVLLHCQPNGAGHASGPPGTLHRGAIRLPVQWFRFKWCVCVASARAAQLRGSVTSSDSVGPSRRVCEACILTSHMVSTLVPYPLWSLMPTRAVSGQVCKPSRALQLCYLLFSERGLSISVELWIRPVTKAYITHDDRRSRQLYHDVTRYFIPMQ